MRGAFKLSVASGAAILWVARVHNRDEEGEEEEEEGGEGAFIIVTDALFVHVQRRHPCAVII